MRMGKEERMKRVKEMTKLQAERTPNQQIARLDAKFGVENGATRERERLNTLIKHGHGGKSRDECRKGGTAKK